MSTDISQRIRFSYGSFSKGQKKIANAILNDYDKAADMTAAALGKMVGVSESTVVRFANHLGYEGYGEFQHAISELIRTKLTPIQRIEITKKRLGRNNLLEKVMESDIAKIKYTMENIDADAFYSTVDALLGAKTIYIMGARSAEPVAKLLYYNLSLIFDNVKFIEPKSTAEVFEQMFNVSSSDILLAFSFPRYSSMMINAVKYAAESGAKIAVVTDSDISPLVEFATYLLIAQSDMASYMDSLVAPISIINAMIVEITNRREKEITERFDKLEKVWDEYRVYAKR